MEPNKDKKTLALDKPEHTKKNSTLFFQGDGGLDPVLVELSDVLPAKVFKNIHLD